MLGRVTGRHRTAVLGQDRPDVIEELHLGLVDDAADRHRNFRLTRTMRDLDLRFAILECPQLPSGIYGNNRGVARFILGERGDIVAAAGDLIGGLGFDSSNPAATPPSGWTARFETTGGQIAEQADRTQATAGATGTATWTFSTAKAVAAWRTALKPAG